MQRNFWLWTHLLLLLTPLVSAQTQVDANDDGSLNIADAIAILGYLFGRTPRLPDPFDACPPDPTEDTLSCECFTACDRPCAEE